MPSARLAGRPLGHARSQTMLGAETLDLIQLDVGVLRHRHGGIRDPPVGAGQPGGQRGLSSGLSMQPGVAGMRNNFAMCGLP